MFASETIPAGIFLILLFFVPDTPRSLVLKSQPEKAMEVLTKVNGFKEAEKILADIQNTVVSHSGKLFSFGMTVIVIGVLLSVFQQFVGINVVLYYAPEIFKSMGSGTDTALLQTIIVGSVNLLFTVLAIMTVDKLGRKPLMIVGALGMAISMFALGTTFFTETVGIAALVFMLFYVASFAMSWGPVTWVLLSEIFPNRIRGRAMAIAVAAQWISNYLISWTFPLIAEVSGGFTFAFYSICMVAQLIWVLFVMKETKGFSLEEIQKQMGIE